MNKPFTLKGYWFLPNQEEQKIAGILSFEPGENMRLELFGAISQKSPEEYLRLIAENWDKNEIIPVIHGHTSDGKEFSLLNCIDGQSSLNFNAEFPLTSYIVNAAIQGILITDYQEPVFNKIRVKLTQLHEWLGTIGFQQSYNFEDSSSNFGFKLPESVSFSISGDYDLSFNSGYEKYNVSRDELNIKQSSFVEIKIGSLVSYRKLGEQIFLFLDFLSLGTLSPIMIETMTVFNEEIDEDGKAYTNTSHVFYKSEQKSAKGLKKDHDFLFNYETISDVFEEIIKKWYTLDSEIRPIRQYLIESVQPIGTFKTNHFLNIIQALEGFHTRFRNKKMELKERLEDIVTEFSDVQLVKNEFNDLEETLNSAKDSRHYYSHFFKLKNNKTKHGVDLYHLTIKLRILLVCCVLKEAGFTNAKINDILVSGKL
ncbi:ApeA N-terminal domain 1-containing protein [Dyadobacter psychrotolerans]|uniref:Uncharacterized protein n=1 Tax=Dyadobacter psychrotolerans TaxID=2541721 RepID=A0A4R5DZD8_9BACT|nr:HEPN domain-containing protein [Dyadobacter psychrotolerans]TDE18064.1 hypothetical protein E0F88_00485 [Dyadobacter psychrotolerans]